MTTTISGSAGASQIRYPIRMRNPRSLPIIYTPSGSSASFEQGDLHRQYCTPTHPVNSNMLPCLTQGQIYRSLPTKYTSPSSPSVWPHPYVSQPSSTVSDPTQFQQMPPHPTHYHSDGSWFTQATDSSWADQRDISNLYQSTPCTSRQDSSKLPFTASSQCMESELPGGVHSQNTEKGGTSVQDNWDCSTVPAAQSAYQGDANEWDWNGGHGSSANRPRYSVERSSVVDDAIVINGVKYVKAETAEGASVHPNSLTPDSLDRPVNDDHESAQDHSEVHSQEGHSDTKYDGEDEACSQAGGWPQACDNLGYQDRSSVKEDYPCSDPGAWNVECQDDEVNLNWDNAAQGYGDQNGLGWGTEAQGTVENPIKVVGLFDDEPMPVRVGTDLMYEHKVHQYTLGILLRQGEMHDQILAMEDNQTVVLKGIRTDAFEQMIACVYAGYPYAIGSEVLSIFKISDMGNLYQAAKFFGFNSLARSILDVIFNHEDPYRVFMAASVAYDACTIDDDLQVLLRRHVAHLLDLRGTPSNNSRWSLQFSTFIKPALICPQTPELFRKDVMDVIIDKATMWDSSKNEESSTSQSGNWVTDKPAQPDSDCPDIPIISDSMSEEFQAFESTKSVGQEDPDTLVRFLCSESNPCNYHNNEPDDYEGVQEEAENPVKEVSGLSAVAVRDYGCLWTRFNFIPGDHISNVAILTDLPRSQDEPVKASGICKGEFGIFPVSHVRFEERYRIDGNCSANEADLDADDDCRD